MTDQPVTSTRRRTVEENRERILTAAEELFAERGIAVTLNDIARHAGLGVGTAYRRFANKDEVIDALFLRRLDQFVALAAECAAEPDAWTGLTRYLESSLELEVQDRGLNQLIASALGLPGRGRVDDWRERLAPLVEQMIGAAKAQGTMRPDVEVADIVYLRAALTATVDLSRETHPHAFRRYLAIILDGLRAEPDAPTALRVAAPDVRQTRAGMAAVSWTPTS